MKIRENTLNEIIDVFKNIDTNNFSIVEVYNDKKTETLTIAYTKRSGGILNKIEFVNYSDIPFNEKEINNLNRYIKLLNKVNQDDVKNDIHLLIKELLLNINENCNNKEQINILKKYLSINKKAFLIIIIINIIQLII